MVDKPKTQASVKETLKPKSPKLEALRKQQDELKARIAEVERREKARERTSDTRLKVLVGAAILADVQKNSENLPLIGEILERAVVAPRDREFLQSRGWLKA